MYREFSRVGAFGSVHEVAPLTNLDILVLPGWAASQVIGDEGTKRCWLVGQQRLVIALKPAS
jgi:hypothetical protein